MIEFVGLRRNENITTFTSMELFNILFQHAKYFYKVLFAIKYTNGKERNLLVSGPVGLVGKYIIVVVGS